MHFGEGEWIGIEFREIEHSLTTPPPRKQAGRPAHPVILAPEPFVASFAGSFDPRGKNDGQVDNVAYFQCK